MADNVRTLLWGPGYALPQDIIVKIQRPMKCHLMHSIGGVCKVILIVVGWLGKLVPGIIRGWKSVHLLHQRNGEWSKY